VQWAKPRDKEEYSLLIEHPMGTLPPSSTGALGRILEDFGKGSRK
jgi:hypothetical protein